MWKQLPHPEQRALLRTVVMFSYAIGSGLKPNGAAGKQSPPAVATDVKTLGGAMEMRSLLNSDVNLAVPRCLPANSGLRSRLRRWCS